MASQVLRESIYRPYGTSPDWMRKFHFKSINVKKMFIRISLNEDDFPGIGNRSGPPWCTKHLSTVQENGWCRPVFKVRKILKLTSVRLGFHLFCFSRSSHVWYILVLPLVIFFGFVSSISLPKFYGKHCHYFFYLSVYLYIIQIDGVRKQNLLNRCLCN